MMLTENMQQIDDSQFGEEDDEHDDGDDDVLSKDTTSPLDIDFLRSAHLWNDIWKIMKNHGKSWKSLRTQQQENQTQRHD